MAIKKYTTPKTLLVATFLMLILPIMSYFLSRRIFQEYFHFADNSVYIASAIVSVLTIHGVLFGVIILAYKEEQLKSLEEKED